MNVPVHDCRANNGHRYLAIAIALVAFAGGASAQGVDDRLANTCTSHAPAEPEEKIAACTSLIGQETRSERLAILYSSRGAAWRQKGDLDRAIADHDKAIQLQPDAALLYFNRAITWQSREQSTRAMADFSAAIQHAPNFVIAYRGRGDLFYLQADYASAIKDYDAALRVRPRDAIALVKRGLSKWKLGDEEGGKSDLSAAMRLDPVTAVAMVSRAGPGSAIRRSEVAGGQGGAPFDDQAANAEGRPMTAITITAARSVADRRQKFIAKVQPHWAGTVGPVHGGAGGAVILDPETRTIEFSGDEIVQRMTIFYRRFKWPDAANAPVWISGIRLRTSKSSYTVGDAEGSTADCAVDPGERIVGLFGRSGAYLDALGCLIR
jgi:tetratricopeptide (TPR) repeat protein